MERFAPDLLDDEWPFEIDHQVSHLFKHPHLGVEDGDVWASEPWLYPAKPPAHWLMVAEVAGRVSMVPLAPSTRGDPSRCRPIGCYLAARLQPTVTGFRSTAFHLPPRSPGRTNIIADMPSTVAPTAP